MAKQQGPAKLSKEWTTVLSILGAALLYKIVYLTFYSQQMPFYANPIGDSLIYLQWAGSILNGDFWGLHEPFKVFYRAPLYPYLLAVSLKVFGNTLLPIYVAQILLGVFSLFLTYKITRKLFSHQAGVIAIVLAAFYAPLAFKETKLVSVTLVITLMLLGAWLLIRAYGLQLTAHSPESGAVSRQPSAVSRWPWFLAGLCFGLATIAWGGSIVVLPLVFVFWLFLRAPRPAFRLPVFLALGWFLMVLPVTLHNVLVGNDLVLVNANSGYTLYQGNNPGAAGMISNPPEIYEQAINGRYPTGIGDQQGFDQGYASSKLYPPKQGEKQQLAKPSEASGFWMKRGLSWMAKNPAPYLRLEFRKLVMMLSDHEFPSNYYIAVELDEVPVLRVLFTPFALILALGMLGIVVVAGSKRVREQGSESDGDSSPRVWPLHLVIVATALTLLVFYVGMRYRLPLVLPLTVFAGKGADALIQQWRQKKVALGQVAILVVALVISWVLCFVPLREGYAFTTMLGWRNLGECYSGQGAQNPLRGELALNRAIAVYEANNGFGHTQLSEGALSEIRSLKGNTLATQQKFDSAIAQYKAALETDPRMTDALSKLALTYYNKTLAQAAKENQPPNKPALDTALSYAVKYRQSDSTGIPANALLGDIHLARGDTAEALSAYQFIARLDTAYIPAWLAASDLMLARGRSEEAIAGYERAWRLDTFSLSAPLKLGNFHGTQGRDSLANVTFATAVNRIERDPKILKAVLQTQNAGPLIDLKYFLGISSLNLQDWSNAEKQAKEILALAPKHQGAQQLLENAQRHLKPK